MPDSEPKVSIGLPVYNGGKYLPAVFKALLSQTHRNLELVVSDNASTDNTEQVCREFADSDDRVRYVRQAENLGATANFNFVLDEAVGEFYMWAAHDDWWKPTFIADAIEAMKDETVGFVFPTTVVKSIHLHFYKKIPSRLFKGFESKNKKVRVLTFANLHQYSYKCNMVYSLYRTELLRRVYSSLDFNNEFVFCMAMLGASRGAVLDRYNFYKQYPYRWPGVKRRRSKSDEKQVAFEKWRDDTTETVKALFPEISDELDVIRSQHQPAKFHSGFQIVDGLPMPE